MAQEAGAEVAGVTGRKPFRPSFHLWMTLAMAAFVFTGFGMTYLAPLAAGTRTGDPPIVHLHGIVFFSWMLLLVTQALLVNVKNVKLHRSLGTFGIAIATLVVFMGCMITIVGSEPAFRTGVVDSHGVFFLSVLAPPSFAVIFAMAIRAVRTPHVHRDLILIAVISILMPGINRVYMQVLGLEGTPIFATYMTMNLMIALVFYNAWKTQGSIGRARWIAAAIVVIPQPINPLVSYTAWWEQLIFFLGSLVYYR